MKNSQQYSYTESVARGKLRALHATDLLFCLTTRQGDSILVMPNIKIMIVYHKSSVFLAARTSYL